MVKNVHTRDIKASLHDAGVLIDGLASGNDRLWPRDRWPAMRFDRPLSVGALGGHGPIGYVVEAYNPGRYIRFRFTAPRGFNGTHAFDIEEIIPGMVRIRHVIDMQVGGSARITWPLMIRWLHDALIDDAFDRAGAFLMSSPVKLRNWSLWVRFLRRVIGRKRPGSRV